MWQLREEEKGIYEYFSQTCLVNTFLVLLFLVWGVLTFTGIILLINNKNDLAGLIIFVTPTIVISLLISIGYAIRTIYVYWKERKRMTYYEIA